MLTLQCEIKIKNKSTNIIVIFDYVNSIGINRPLKKML